MPDESGCNPIGKAYKRFQNGEADNIAWLYHTLVEIPREKLVPKPKSPGQGAEMEERVRAGVVECKQLLIRDDAGHLRAAITTTPDGAVGIALNSPTEDPRMLFSVNEKGEAQSDLYDQDGKVRVGIRVDAAGNPTINLLDSHGGKRLVLTLLPPEDAEGPAIVLTDEKRDIRMAINVPRHGTALLEMYDANRRRTFAAAALPNGPAALSMYDARGQVRTEVSVEPTGVGNFILYDSTGKEIYHPDGTA